VGKPKAPKAPDYAAAAAAQGEANLNSALATNYLNQPNQVGPDGSLTFSYDYANGNTLPDGTVIPRTTATTTLSPEQQRLYNQNNAISAALNDLAQRGIGYVDQASQSPIDASTLPGLREAPQVQNMDGNLTGGMPINGSIADAGPMAGKVNNANLQNRYDFSGASRAPTFDDFVTDRDRVTEALMSRMRPELDRQRKSRETVLANQGLNMGSEAYNREQEILGQNDNDAFMQSILAGTQEQQRQFQNAMNLRNQGVSEAMAQGDLFNTAQNTKFGQDMAIAGLTNDQQAQRFGQNAATAAFGNEAAAQDFAQKLQQLQAANQARESTFNQGLASSQFQNQARAQALQEADYLKNQPLNMLNALRSGNQTSMPQFGNVSTGAQVQAAPVYAAANDQYQAAMDAYEQKMANFSALTGGLAQLGGAAITKFSDRRLKTNIRKLWTKTNGLGVYAFNYLWSAVQEIGYMADEVVKLFPEAVVPHPSGYVMVDYGKVG